MTASAPGWRLPASPPPSRPRKSLYTSCLLYTSGATATLIERAEHAGEDMVIAHYYRVDGGKTTRHGFLKRRDVMDQREFARDLKT